MTKSGMLLLPGMIGMMESLCSLYGQPGSTANPPVRPNMPAENTSYSFRIPMKRNGQGFVHVNGVDLARSNLLARNLSTIFASSSMQTSTENSPDRELAVMSL